MKHIMRSASSVVCSLLLILGLVLPAAAADGQKYYDCTLYLFGVDAAAENIVTRGVAIQVQAGDGSGGTWAVASYAVTNGSTYYVATDAADTSVNTTAELIASDADSGIAVFRLKERIGTCTAPALRTLDGVSTQKSVAVAGLGEKEGSTYFFSRAAYIQDLTARNGYTCISLKDSPTSSLSDYAIYPVAAVMTSMDEVIGFYIDNYMALPAGYIMPSANGIGTLDKGDAGSGSAGSGSTGSGSTGSGSTGSGSTGSGDIGSGQQTPPAGGTTDPGQDESGNYSFSTVETPKEVLELISQAEAERTRANILRVVLIVLSVAAAGGIIAFALLKSRRGRGSAPAPGPQPQPSQPQPVQPMGKTEYVGAQEYGKTEPALPTFRVVPLAGTPGQGREIPPQGLTFGRDPACDLSFPPDTGGVSGRHCSLTWSGGALRLTDLDSSFGTLLEDGQKLSGTGAEIRPGMCFYLGSRKIGFRVEEQ